MTYAPNSHGAQLSSTGPFFRKVMKQMEMPMFCIDESKHWWSREEFWALWE